MSEINIRDIDNMSDLEFAKSLGIWGGSFLVYYVNNGEPNEKYIERLSNMVLIRRYADPNDYESFEIADINRGFGILSAIETFENFDKIKLISAIGDVNFVENNKFFIELDLLHKEEIPEYLEHILDIENNLVDYIFKDLISIKITNDEKLYDASFEIYEFYAYNIMGFSNDEIRGYFYLGENEDIEFMVSQEKAEELEYDDVVELIYLEDDYIKDICGWYDHIKEIISNYNIMQKYISIGGEINNLVDFVYENIVGSLIHFHDENSDNIYDDYETLALGVCPIFFYEKDNRFSSKTELIDEIMKYKN
ncbi:MAG: hypothetical protein ACOCRK_01960 [bacterium]